MALEWDAIIDADVETGYSLVQRAAANYARGSRALAETAHAAAELQYTRALIHLSKAVKNRPSTRAAARKIAQFWDALQALSRNGRQS